MDNIINLVAFNNLLYEDLEIDDSINENHIKENLEKKVAYLKSENFFTDDYMKKDIDIDGYEVSVEYLYKNMLDNITTVLFNEFKKTINCNDYCNACIKCDYSDIEVFTLLEENHDELDEKIDLFFKEYLSIFNKTGVFHDLFMNYYNLTNLNPLQNKILDYLKFNALKKDLRLNKKEGKL